MGLGAGVVGLFFLPAVLVMNGCSVAGDRAGPGAAADVESAIKLHFDKAPAEFQLSKKQLEKALRSNEGNRE